MKDTNNNFHFRSMRRMKADDLDYHHFTTSKSVYDIFKAGGLVETGAHGQRQGVGFHWELQMFEQGGMTPMEVLYTGTMGNFLFLCFFIFILLLFIFLFSVLFFHSPFVLLLTFLFKGFFYLSFFLSLLVFFSLSFLFFFFCLFSSFSLSAGAKALGFDKYLGSLTGGKLADLVVYDSATSPLASIGNSASPKMVSKAGRLWDAASMAQLLPVAKPLPPGPQLNIPIRGQ